MSSTAERSVRWEFQSVNNRGRSYGEPTVAETVEDIQASYHPDYIPAIAQAAEAATESIDEGEWQEVILGPPLLADAVDRLRIRAVYVDDGGQQ